MTATHAMTPAKAQLHRIQECAIDGCDRARFALGFCTMHYQRAGRGSVRLHDPASRTDRTRSRIEDLEFLVEGGVPLESALTRAGWTASAAARTLYRRKHRYATDAQRIAARQSRAA